MKYLKRSIKYFCASCVLSAVLVTAMIACGFTDFDFSDSAPLWQHTVVLLAILALMAAIYPALTFTKRRVAGTLSPEGKAVVLNAFRKAGYEPAGEPEAGVWRFRYKSLGRRLRRLYDDEIVVTQEEGCLLLDGHRAELFRVLHHWDAYARYDA